jgi:hypothetical protein
MHAPRRSLAGSALTLALFAGLSDAQAPPGPLALGPAVPLGIRRGSALDLTLSGTGLADPLALWTSFPARAELAVQAGAGKDSTKIRVRLEVPADAPVGLHRLRLVTGHGVSNVRPFCVDDLPQLLEANDNHTRPTAQPVPVPCVVVGRADAEVSDYFRIHAEAGQRVSAEVIGRRLGSALDPVLFLYDTRSGHELSLVYSDDAPGLQTDARLTHTFAQAGDYLLEVRDTTHRGGPDFHYRLRVGDFPCAVTPWPLAARRGTKLSVGFAGPQLDGVAPVEMTVPDDPGVEAVNVTPVGKGGLAGWPVELMLSGHDELTSTDANHSPEKAMRLPVPGGVSGRFLRKGERDYYAFAAKKGEKLTVAAQAAELLSPADVYLTLHDVKGAELARSNPQEATKIAFTAPADGDYRVTAEHLNYAFGPSEVYRLTVTPAAPGFEINLAADAFTVAAGQTVTVPVQALMRRDYAGPIAVSVTGPKGLSGAATIPANSPNTNPTGPPAVALPLTAVADLPPGAYVMRVVARATINGREVVETASVRGPVSAALGGLPFPPRAWSNEVMIGVTPRPPLTLKVEPAAVTVKPGETAKVKVTVGRHNLPAAVLVQGEKVPAKLAVPAAILVTGRDEGEVEIQAAADAAPAEKLALELVATAPGTNNVRATAPVTVTIKK